MHKILTCYFLALALGMTFSSNAQTAASINYFAAVKNYDLVNLWLGDSIAIEGGDRILFPEPLGYIGGNYQRFYIHYITIKKRKDNPYQYLVYGKTKVRNNICHFNGKITIAKAIVYKKGDDPRYKQGTVTCNISFNEDSTEASSGFIRGKLTTHFYIDERGKIHYDALAFGADGFSNNECSAIWTSYKTGNKLKCNWGDFRIPESGDLDIGAGEFSVADDFIKNGWENYTKAWNTYQEKPEVLRARRKENEKWWQ